MKKHYDLHQDYRTLFIGVPMHAPVLRLFQRMTRFLYTREDVPESVCVEASTIEGFDGKRIRIECFFAREAKADAPCILFLHGGAFALPANDFHKRLITKFVLSCACKVVLVDYRLVPDYPYPYGLRDCFSAYAYLVGHAQELKIDVQRLALYGDSAGGALAAGLTQMIRDGNLPMPSFQMLVYPVLDMQQHTQSMQHFVDTPIWNARQNQKMWKLYAKTSEDATYISPAQASSFAHLPAAYIEVNEFDCLRDEALVYAENLKNAGIEVFCNQTKGTVHGFELAWKSAYTQAIIEQRISYLQHRFAP